jgi:hypothetical protein
MTLTGLALVCIDHQSVVQGHACPTTTPYFALASFVRQAFWQHVVPSHFH